MDIFLYPLTIIADRYMGIFCGGQFIAWNCEPEYIPTDIFGGDGDNLDIWKDILKKDEEEKRSLFRTYPLFGIGSSINEAVDNLDKRVKEYRQRRKEIENG